MVSNDTDTFILGAFVSLLILNQIGFFGGARKSPLQKRVSVSLFVMSVMALGIYGWRKNQSMKNPENDLYPREAVLSLSILETTSGTTSAKRHILRTQEELDRVNVECPAAAREALALIRARNGGLNPLEARRYDENCGREGRDHNPRRPNYTIIFPSPPAAKHHR